MKISLISIDDYANSGLDIANAIKKNSDYEVEYFLARNVFSTQDREYIKNSDVLILKGDDLPVFDERGTFNFYRGNKPRTIKKCPNKDIETSLLAKRILIVSGSGFRRNETNTKQRNCYAFNEIYQYRDNSDYIFALTPDLNYPEIKGSFLGHCLDGGYYAYRQRKIPVISCYPASGGVDRKGVFSYLVPALELLRNEGYQFRLVKIQDMSYKESVNVKKLSDIYFENIQDYGCYGKSGVEAMQYGTPIIARIKQAIIEQSGIDYALPFLKVDSSIESVYLTLKNCFDKKYNLQQISRDTYRYYQENHTSLAIFTKIDNVIKQITALHRYRPTLFVTPKSVIEEKISQNKPINKINISGTVWVIRKGKKYLVRK